MGLLEEWDRVNNDRVGAKKWALNKGTPRDTQPYIQSGGGSRLPEDVIKAVVQQNTEKPGSSVGGYSSPRGNGGTRQGVDDIPESAYRDGPSFMDQLMGRISSKYEPQMPPGAENSARIQQELFSKITGQLDAALSAKLGAIGNVRNTAQQNYNTSDSNLAAMFKANADNIASSGSQRFGQIAAENQGAINSQRDLSVGQLKSDRDESMARRTEMLNRLGIQAAGAQVDPGDETLNNAVTATTNRADQALQQNQGALATNQAYNQSVVNSVNQQGGERRAALMQQLQSIQNKLGMAEAEAQDQTAQQKSQLEMQRLQAEAQAQPSFEDYNKFGYQQFRDDRDLAFELYKTMTSQDKAGSPDQAPRVQGYAGLAQDLVNQGIPQDQAGQYMGALSQVLGSEYMQGIHPDEGYDRASIISRRLMEEMHVPPAIAAQLATNYANLGNNAYYTQQ